MSGVGKRWWQPVTTQLRHKPDTIPAKDESPIAVFCFPTEDGWEG